MTKNPTKVFVFLMSAHISYCLILCELWYGFFMMLFLGIGWSIPELTIKDKEKRYSDSFCNGLAFSVILFFITIWYLYCTDRFLYDIKDTAKYYGRDIVPFVVSSSFWNSLGLTFLHAKMCDRLKKSK